MQLLMFSGNSLRNRDWIYEAKERFEDLFDSFYVQNYWHWGTGADWIDFPYELDVLRTRQPRFDNEYGVFAKSIGTVLTVQAIDQKIIKPKWLLLCGLPLGYITREYPQCATVLSHSGLPVTIVHNQHDRVGDAKEAADYLSPSFASRGDYKFIQTPGDTHDYESYDLLRTQLIALRDHR